VIIDTTNRIVATGYNGPPTGWTKHRLIRRDEHLQIIPAHGDCRDWCERGRNGPTDETLFSYADCPTIHAEANALSFCDRRHREEGTLYVTSPTCIGCAKLVANSGLKRVVMLGDGDRTYRVGDGVDGASFMEKSGLRVDILND